MKAKLINSHTIFLLIAFLLLFISFTWNPFKIAYEDYHFFDREDESNIISRLLMSRDEGVFSKGGLNGSYFYHQYHLEEGDEIPYVLKLVDGDTAKLKELDPFALISQNYDDYINNRKTYGGVWNTYKSQPAGQSFLYVLLDNVLPFDNGKKLVVYRLITIFLCVIVFILITKWILNNFGLITAIVTFILIFFSHWLIVFSYNLWWVLWSYYVPFVTMLFVLDHKMKNNDGVSDLKVYLLLSLTVFAKFFFTGAEFLTSTLIMTICPIVFYLIVTRAELKDGVSFFLKSSIASVLGVFAGMLLLIVQIRAVDGSWMAGVDHILYSFVKRSAYAENFESMNMLDIIIDKGINAKIFYRESFPAFNVSFGIFFIVVSLLSIIVYIVSKKKGGDMFLKIKALIIVTTISVVGPMSWFVIFTQHLYQHLFFDPIVWYMPYSIYGFCVMGVSIQMLADYVKRKRMKQQLTI